MAFAGDMVINLLGTTKGLDRALTRGAIKVKGFLDTVKGEGASRGIFITTGYFTNEAINLIEDEPVELVNVVSFISYLKKFSIYENVPDQP